MLNLKNAHTRYTLEILLILILLYLFTPMLHDWSETRRLQGGEYSYLINSGAIAARIFKETGAIPRWNPFIGTGEPLIEGPFSFVLNPLMTLPILAWGPIVGAKIAVLIHIFLAGIGGWALAYVLDFRAPGRLMLAVLCGANGSIAGAIALGFYQMGLSQTYMPWVFAGLIGLLRYENSVLVRRYTGILALASTLMVFAGTFWYVLPTAISALILTMFALFSRHPIVGIYKIPKLITLRRIFFAALLTIGLISIRLMPQAMNHNLVEHPRELLDEGILDFFQLTSLYFRTELPKAFPNIMMHYHYIVHPVFALVLLVLWAWLYRQKKLVGKPIYLTALILVFIYTVWAQEGTWILKRLYEAFPVLSEWRFVARIMGAATPWIAVLVAGAVDQIISSVLTGFSVKSVFPVYNKMRIVNVIFIFAVLLNTFHVAQNWKRIAGAEPHFSYTAPFLYFLRANHPSDFLAVETWYYFNDYLPFYEVLARATFGNPDYHPVSISPTIGKRQAMDFLPEYVITSWDIPFDELPGDYEQIASTPDDFTSILWQHNTTPPYAFTITRNQIAIRTRPIQREDTNPVQAFVHNIDHVQVWVDEYPPGSYLVITETAYPGWQVTINNQPARLESVGGLVGVELPERPEGTIEIHFSYKPRWLTIGGFLTLASAFLLIGYLMQLGKRVKYLLKFTQFN